MGNPRSVSRTWIRIAVVLAVGVGFAARGWIARATSGSAQVSMSDGGLVMSPCRLRDVSEEVRCGELSVPEDRSKPAGRKIGLRVAVVPALSADARPDPVFVLAGGPGQAATELVDKVLPMFERVHRNRDLVFVDQRGTGKSSPLTCPAAEDAGLAEQFSEASDAPELHACLDRYQRDGIDVRQYLTPQAMDDLDQVRAALGYSKIDLWGVSYGTRAALVYIQRHPDHVRAAVIDAVAPQTDSLLLTSSEDGQRAFELIFDACAKDRSCSATYPDLRKKFVDLLARLQAQPAHVKVPHPITGAPTELTLTRNTFVMNLHALLYVPEIATLLPLIIQRAWDGDFGPFVAQAYATSNGVGGGLARGMFHSVICAEDAPQATPEARAKHNRPELFFGDTFAAAMQEDCAFWPRGELPAGYHDPVHAEVPVLLLSGELDPITPPVHAESVKAGLPNSLHIIAPGVGHGTTQQGCVPELVAQFLEAGRTDAVDAGCVAGLTRPPFFVSFAGPSP